MRLYVPLALVLFCVLISCHGRALVESSEKNELEIWEDDLTLERPARFIPWGAMGKLFGKFISVTVKFGKNVIPKVLKFGSHTLTVVSLGMSLANALSGGCATRQAICDLKDTIVEQEEEVFKLSEYLKGEYESMKSDYFKVQDVTADNIRIERKMEGLLDALEGIKSVADTVDRYLSSQIELHDKMDKTSDEYLALVGTPNEFMNMKVKDFFSMTKQNAMKMFGIGVGMQLGMQLVSVGIEGGITRAVKSYKSTGYYDFQGKSGKFKTFSKRVKLAFKPRRPNLRVNPKNFASKVGTKLKNGAAGFMNKLKNPKGLVKSYFKGQNMVSAGVNMISIAASAIMIYFDNKQWQDLEDQLRQTVANYTQLIKDLQANKVVLENTDKNMSRILSEQVDVFKDIATNFTEDFDDSLNDTNILEAYGQETDLPDGAVELAKLGEITVENVREKQEQICRVMDDAEFSMIMFKNFMSAFKVCLEIVKNKIDDDKSDIKDIISHIRIAFTNNENIKNYTDLFVSADKVICSVAELLPNQSSFGSFPLDSLKEPCSQSSKYDLPPQYKEEHKEFGLKYTISKKLADDKKNGELEDLYSVMDEVNKFFESDPILDTSEEKSAKECLCLIAKYMPDLKKYYYISLDGYKDCNSVSDDQFDDDMFEAEDIAYLWELVERYRSRNRDPCSSSRISKSAIAKEIPC